MGPQGSKNWLQCEGSVAPRAHKFYFSLDFDIVPHSSLLPVAVTSTIQRTGEMILQLRVLVTHWASVHMLFILALRSQRQ